MVVADTGAVSYRAFDNGVLDPGSGTAYDPWDHWRDDPSPVGAVSAAILAAPTQHPALGVRRDGRTHRPLR